MVVQIQERSVDQRATDNQIRIELIVYDSAGKFSEKHRMYFVVVPEASATKSLQSSGQRAVELLQFDEDTLTISGSVLRALNRRSHVEAAFFQENFSASSVMKYNMSVVNPGARAPHSVMATASNHP